MDHFELELEPNILRPEKRTATMDEEKHAIGEEECGGSEDCAIFKRMLAYEFSEEDLVHLEMM